MSRPEITIHNAATGITVVREMTDEELAAYEAEQTDASPVPDSISNPS